MNYEINKNFLFYFFYFKKMRINIKRTNNHKRFLRFKISSQIENNLSKGSRQIRPVTSGKGLALLINIIYLFFFYLKIFK